MKKPSISFFCPAYYDEGNLPLLIPRVYQVLRKHTAEFEIVIINDGSPDRTGVVAEELAKKFAPKVKVIHHQKNLGYGAALKRGFQQAKKFDYVFYTDGDNQYDATELKKMMPFLKEYDAIVGYRTKRALSLTRKIQTLFFNRLVRWLFGIKIKDVNCSMKIISKEALKQINLTSDSSFIEAELLIKLKQKNFKIKEVEVSHFPRRFGKASGGNFKVIMKTIFEMIRLYLQRSRLPFFGALLAGSIFLLIGLLTLSDYGIMWDARGHFARGQAYVDFLTGRKTNERLPVTAAFVRYYRDYLSRSGQPSQDVFQRLSSDPNYRRSIYHDESDDPYWNQNDFGHPPLSGIGAAIFNIIFYEKLGLLRDDHAYNLFSIFLASILVSVVFYWLATSYGWLAALVGGLTLTTYPSFWAESHFNIKDIPQAVFFSLAIWGFWRAINRRSLAWMIGSAILAGCALGTKFNAVFLPFILIPWFFISGQNYRRWRWWLFIYPMIMLAILFISYPLLWQNPWFNFLKVFNYYRDIGSNIDYTPRFRTIGGFNTYALIWICLTTYPGVILLTMIGMIGAMINAWRSKDFLPLLFLFWLLVPILRVSLPRIAIYGGARQIMEYIPALSLLAGYGSFLVVEKLSHQWKNIGRLIILLGFISLLVTLVRYHPAENAYFNSMIGGLAGAKKSQIIGWGNTFGGVYHQGIDWLNSHVEPDSHLATAFSDTADFYIPELREDIQADQKFSGYLQQGEYIIGLTHHSGLEHTYRLRYLETYLEPVYIFSVDQVPLLKIWKNDRLNLKPEIKSRQEQVLTALPVKKAGGLFFDLGKVERVTRVEIEFEETSFCQPLELAYFQISQNGKKWEILPETYPGSPIDVLGNQPQGGKLIAPIASLPARYISLNIEPEDACLFKPTVSRVFLVY